MLFQFGCSALRQPPVGQASGRATQAMARGGSGRFTYAAFEADARQQFSPPAQYIVDLWHVGGEQGAVAHMLLAVAPEYDFQRTDLCH